ncbi:MAG: hypothetical protein M3R63_05700 [Actinomycetota bacterium]|nr:hypothetical protein [Actinomycetota bacterium]
MAYLLITVSVGLTVAAMTDLPLWRLLAEAHAGRGAQGHLAAAEERLRFAL